LRRIAAAEIATGIEPRVPQKRTRTVEDLADERLHGGDREEARLDLGLLGGQHQHAEPGAADVVDAREVEDHVILSPAAVLEIGGKRRPQHLRRFMVDAPVERHHDDIDEA
jgi:hypothetical protein